MPHFQVTELVVQSGALVAQQTAGEHGGSRSFRAPPRTGQERLELALAKYAARVPRSAS